MYIVYACREPVNLWGDPRGSSRRSGKMTDKQTGDIINM